MEIIHPITVYVTGASGFVGQNLIPYLSKSELTVINLSRTELLSGNFDFKENSIIVHLAGKAHDLRKTSNDEEYYTVNFDLTKQLYDSFLTSKAKKFIFISSVKAAADSVSGVLMENQVESPLTPYGKSKLMAEQYLQAQELPSGKSYCILRPCMIHGPGNKGNLNLLYKFIKKGIPYPLAAFENKRSFLSVANLCVVIAAIIKKENQIWSLSGC
jgi:nucleoside-diphosphate-sugar epimerase